MPVPAIPSYLIIERDSLPPGHRFGCFFPIWNDQSWSKAKDDDKNSALRNVFDYQKFRGMSEALLRRQKRIAESLEDNIFEFSAESISPFITGIGMEHPLENGFAFLNPYGLPYLPGSGVKGVLRRTAEYLRDKEFGDSDFGWVQPAIDTLFGPEPKVDEDSRRGALVFWDVYIQPRGYKLGMDILTPHFGKYYKGEETPHESGQPVPLPFLVVPPGAAFDFHIQCNSEFIQDEGLKTNWRGMVETLLEHSFEWLGFGAKTSGGYGQFESTKARTAANEAASKKSLAESGIKVGSEVWLGARIKSAKPGAGEIEVENLQNGHIASGKFFSQLSDSARNRLKRKRSVYVNVEIMQKGNLVMITSMEEVERE